MNHMDRHYSINAHAGSISTVGLEPSMVIIFADNAALSSTFSARFASSECNAWISVLHVDVWDTCCFYCFFNLSGCVADLFCSCHTSVVGCAQSLFPCLARFGMIIAQIANVSHLEHVRAGVPIHFYAKFVQVPVCERCWTHAYPGVVLVFASIGLEIVCPWFFVSQSC